MFSGEWLRTGQWGHHQTTRLHVPGKHAELYLWNIALHADCCVQNTRPTMSKSGHSRQPQAASVDTLLISNREISEVPCALSLTTVQREYNIQ